MSQDLTLFDDTLETAGVYLASGAALMRAGNVLRPTDPIETVSGIGANVADSVHGLQLARFALADAAKTAAMAVSAVMEASGSLEAALATAVPPGYAMPGRRH